MPRLRFLLMAILLTACIASPVATPTVQPTLAPPALTLASAPAPTSTVAPTSPPPTVTTAPPEVPSPAPPTPSPSIPGGSCCDFQLVADGLYRPTLVTHAGDERLFILEQSGQVRVVVDGQLVAAPFLDIDAIVSDRANEQGLLGLAFHPNYAENGQFFVNYTNSLGDTVIARYTVSSDPNLADPASGEILFTIDQPYVNHNGGGLAFGPDGLLYVGMGDGGSQGDPRGNGQNPYSFLGKMLRVDVETNPTQPLIWALGLRNPWRFSFDRLTGDLFIGDVGQGEWEEIDSVAASALAEPGPNFGWNIFEGTHRYSDGPADLVVPPIAEYSHAEGGCSVTGGYVYRGTALPELSGIYFFADYCSGIIWSLTPQADGAWERNVFMNTDFTISSFGEDVNGELYVVDHGGAVYRLVKQ
ncbi:MAG: PQQ-dependent sugar dehydrogenase [Chloroflexi bacterium]|nr:PQQ-dependent sugar dehydrogenase [Chloroflexota bacterium]